MSTSAFAIIQLIIILIVISVVASLLIRTLKRRLADQEVLIQRLKKSAPKPRNSPQKKPASVRHQNQPEDNTEGDSGHVITDTVSEMKNDLSLNADSLSNLDSMVVAQAKNIARIKKIRESMEAEGAGTAGDRETFKRELDTANDRNKKSVEVIANLQASLERSRVRISGFERELSLSRKNVSETSGLEKTVKRLSQDNANLKKALKLEVLKHRDIIDRIRAQIEVSEKKKQLYVEETSRRERSMLAAIAKLQAKLRNTMVSS